MPITGVEKDDVLAQKIVESSVRNRKHRAQVNEILCKILCHNICVVIQEMRTEQ